MPVPSNRSLADIDLEAMLDRRVLRVCAWAINREIGLIERLHGSTEEVNRLLRARQAVAQMMAVIGGRERA